MRMPFLNPPDPKPPAREPSLPELTDDNRAWMLAGFADLALYLGRHAAFDRWLLEHGELRECA